MNLTRRRGAVLGASLVLALPLAGCSEGDAEPKMAPTQSVASTPSGEPSGEAGPENSRDTPEKVAREFIRGYNEALSSGDTSRMRHLSADDCEQCREHIRPIEEVHEAGGSFDTRGWSVVRTKTVAETPRQARVQVAVHIAGGRTVPAAGADPVDYEADRRLMLFRMRRTEMGTGPWRISFIGYYS